MSDRKCRLLSHPPHFLTFCLLPLSLLHLLLLLGCDERPCCCCLSATRDLFICLRFTFLLNILSRYFSRGRFRLDPKGVAQTGQGPKGGPATCWKQVVHNKWALGQQWMLPVTVITCADNVRRYTGERRTCLRTWGRSRQLHAMIR